MNIVSYDRLWNRSATTYRHGILRIEHGHTLEEGIVFTGSYATTAVITEPGIYCLSHQVENSNPIRIKDEPRGPTRDQDLQLLLNLLEYLPVDRTGSSEADSQERQVSLIDRRFHRFMGEHRSARSGQEVC